MFVSVFEMMLLKELYCITLLKILVVQITVDSPGSKCCTNLQGFLGTKMHKKLIYSIVLPALEKGYVYKTYKVKFFFHILKLELKL